MDNENEILEFNNGSKVNARLEPIDIKTLLWRIREDDGPFWIDSRGRILLKYDKDKACSFGPLDPLEASEYISRNEGILVEAMTNKNNFDCFIHESIINLEPQSKRLSRMMPVSDLRKLTGFCAKNTENVEEWCELEKCISLFDGSADMQFFYRKEVSLLTLAPNYYKIDYSKVGFFGVFVNWEKSGEHFTLPKFKLRCRVNVDQCCEEAMRKSLDRGGMKSFSDLWMPSVVDSVKGKVQDFMLKCIEYDAFYNFERGYVSFDMGLKQGPEVNSQIMNRFMINAYNMQEVCLRAIHLASTLFLNERKTKADAISSDLGGQEYLTQFM